MAAKPPDSARYTELRNPKALRDYFIHDKFEAGVKLVGTEVKSIRAGKAQLSDAFARLEKGSLWLYGAYIEEYSHGGLSQHAPRRPRQLLLHAHAHVVGATQTGKTSAALIPLGHTTLPVAGSLQELQTLLPALSAKKLQPGIFVVNTFNAREILQGLDPLLGEAPVLFLRRNLYAGKSGLAEHFNLDSAAGSTLEAINNLHARLLSVWNYGSLNAPEIAREQLLRPDRRQVAAPVVGVQHHAVRVAQRGVIRRQLRQRDVHRARDVPRLKVRRQGANVHHQRRPGLGEHAGEDRLPCRDGQFLVAVVGVLLFGVHPEPLIAGVKASAKLLP